MQGVHVHGSRRAERSGSDVIEDALGGGDAAENRNDVDRRVEGAALVPPLEMAPLRAVGWMAEAHGEMFAESLGWKMRAIM